MINYFKARSMLFRDSSFSYACAMSFCSAIVVGIAYVSISWHLLSIKNNIEVIILFMLTWWVFGVVLSPITGYFADRISRRLIIIVTNVSRVILVLLFILFGDMESLSNIYLFTSLWGLILAFFMPAMMIMSRELFLNDDVLLYANSTMDGLFELGMVIGMSLGGLLVVYFDMHQILFIMLVGNILAMFCSFKVVARRNIINKRDGFLKSWQDVASYLNENNSLCWCYIAQVGMTCLYMIAPVFISPYAKNILGASSFEFGLIEMAFSIGFILGNIILPYMIEKIPPKLVLFYSISISTASYLLLALNQDVALAVVYYFVSGMFISSWVIVVTIAQKNTPINLQGKIQGIAYGLSGLVVMLIYALFFVLDYIHPLPSNRWFYILAVLALITLIPVFKGMKGLENSKSIG
jgi:DHA3 family macrolide efflux protein-like MFS transporter